MELADKHLRCEFEINCNDLVQFCNSCNKSHLRIYTQGKGCESDWGTAER